MSEALFSVPKDYSWVLLSVVWIGFQCLMHGFLYAGKGRSKYFTKEFLNKHFEHEHKALTGSEFKRGGGYPDTGSGKYSQKLSYSDWYNYNNLQRIHLNYVEGIATIIILILVSGLYCPCCASLSGVVYIIGRQLVALGYSSNGAAHPLRIVGILMCDIVILANFLIANYGVLKINNII